MINFFKKDFRKDFEEKSTVIFDDINQVTDNLSQKIIDLKNKGNYCTSDIIDIFKATGDLANILIFIKLIKIDHDKIKNMILCALDIVEEMSSESLRDKGLIDEIDELVKKCNELRYLTNLSDKEVKEYK